MHYQEILHFTLKKKSRQKSKYRHVVTMKHRETKASEPRYTL